MLFFCIFWLLTEQFWFLDLVLDTPMKFGVFLFDDYDWDQYDSNHKCYFGFGFFLNHGFWKSGLHSHLTPPLMGRPLSAKHNNMGGGGRVYKLTLYLCYFVLPITVFTCLLEYFCTKSGFGLIFMLPLENPVLNSEHLVLSNWAKYSNIVFQPVI